MLPNNPFNKIGYLFVTERMVSKLFLRVSVSEVIPFFLKPKKQNLTFAKYIAIFPKP